VRPYGTDHRIVDDRVLLVEADGSLPAKVGEVLADGEIESVPVRNVLSSFRSNGSPTDARDRTTSSPREFASVREAL